MINSCKECGCTCKNCFKNDNEIHLHLEIENLKQKLTDRDNHIIKLETHFLKEQSNGDELVLLRDELIVWQEKFQRLSDAHKRVQRVNQGLEDKLLKLVDTCETDKSALTKDVAILSQKLAEANYTIKKLTESNERYKNDVSVAIQFLQCKQSNFVGQKYDSLPTEIQSHVSMYMTQKRKPEEKKTSEAKSIKVPIPTFPPTAMVYSVPKTTNNEEKQNEEPENTVDIVSAAIMAKVLEERERERTCIKHCDTCTCSKTIKFADSGSSYHNVFTQTDNLDACKTCSDIQNNIQVKTFKSSDKVPSSDVENHNNVAKVQPNNFLVEKSSFNTSSLMELNVSLDSSSLNISGDSNKMVVNRHAFTNQLESRTKPRRKSDIPQYHEIPANSKLHLGSPVENTGKTVKNQDNSNFRSAVQCKHKIYANEAKKTLTKNKYSVSESYIQSNDLKTDVPKKQRAYSVTSDKPTDSSIDPDSIDKEKFAEMENHVKQFLFGKTELWKENATFYNNSVDLSSSNKQFSNVSSSS